MNERIQHLRKQSLDATNMLDHERAQLVTGFYRDHNDATEPVAVQRARCFAHIMQNKQLYIGRQELIVGERGPAPKATPSYPEVCLHSLEDLDTLHNRPKVSFKVSEETRRVYREEIIPFWQGRTHRDRLMAAVSDDWLAAYQAGIFTEFQEQRAPGHTVLGRDMFGRGMRDIIAACDASAENIQQEKNAGDEERLGELEAMKIVAKALMAFAGRYAALIRSMAAEAKDATRRNELLQMAGICEKVPANAPESFHEALQHYWFIHLGVITELNPWDSFNPGRLDQHLQPFFDAGIKEGNLDHEKARELLQCFWIKFNNHPAPPKVGITALESNTYTDFTLINMGGLTENGRDAVNEMTYLLLEVIKEMRLLQPGSMIQVSKKNPDQFVHKALEIISTGFGQPSVFNTDAIIQQLLRQGKSLEDARNGGASGCVESGAFGTESYILTGYFNLCKILEVTLHNGFDPRTNKQPGLKTGDPEAFRSFDDLMQAFENQVRHFVDIKIEGNLLIEELFARHLPAPFMSILISDCIANARDYNAGGARYNTSYIQGVGLGSLTDSLTALRHHVFDKKNISMKGMLGALQRDFAGYDEFHQELVFNTPKWGNDDDYADDQALRGFNMFFNAVDDRLTYRGGRFRINMLPTTSHIYFGSVCGALPDGRLSGKPLSEGISPVQGADKKGPTAVLKSAAKIDHIKTGGTLLNQKFTPSFFSDPGSKAHLTALIRAYFRMDGHHIQFNVVSADTLREAQQHPERYRDLIVRVAGYSDYFNDLGEDLQNEIIMRTAQG